MWSWSWSWPWSCACAWVDPLPGLGSGPRQACTAAVVASQWRWRAHQQAHAAGEVSSAPESPRMHAPHPPWWLLHAGVACQHQTVRAPGPSRETWQRDHRGCRPWCHRHHPHAAFRWSAPRDHQRPWKAAASIPPAVCRDEAETTAHHQHCGRHTLGPRRSRISCLGGRTRRQRSRCWRRVRVGKGHEAAHELASTPARVGVWLHAMEACCCWRWWWRCTGLPRPTRSHPHPLPSLRRRPRCGGWV